MFSLFIALIYSKYTIGLGQNKTEKGYPRKRFLVGNEQLTTIFLKIYLTNGLEGLFSFTPREADLGFFAFQEPCDIGAVTENYKHA